MKKNNKKFIIGFILGAIIFSAVGVCAATILNGKDVVYDNSSSKLNSTNVQDALDELNNKAKLKNRSNIVEAYTYNQTTGAEDYCVTGDEDTCVETKCYEDSTAGSCPAGTIIVYKVNENEIVRFHVMYDNGATMTMQSQRNTIYNTMWINAADYAAENTDGTSCSYTSCNDEGPITILNALESATAGWSNVNNQTYTMGTTVFKTNAYTGCTSELSCTTNTYTLPERTAKARMITVQEAYNLGCTSTQKSCPIWMYNYLYNSTSYGGTIKDNTTVRGNYSYWTMNAHSSDNGYAWNVSWGGKLDDGRYDHYTIYHTYYSARAVVVISK